MDPVLDIRIKVLESHDCFQDTAIFRRVVTPDSANSTMGLTAQTARVMAELLHALNSHYEQQESTYTDASKFLLQTIKEIFWQETLHGDGLEELWSEIYQFATKELRLSVPPA